MNLGGTVAVVAADGLFEQVGNWYASQGSADYGVKNWRRKLAPDALKQPGTPWHDHPALPLKNQAKSSATGQAGTA
jgi:hypothetical protein